MSRKLKIRNKPGFGDQKNWGGVDDDIIIIIMGTSLSSRKDRHQTSGMYASDIEREKGVCTVET
jgi:hypothetical protein